MVAQARDIGSYIKAAIGVAPIDSAAATINGPAIARNGALSCVLHQSCGLASGTPTTQTVSAKLQDSADGSTGWADISGAATADLTADSTGAEADIDLSGAKAYIRVVQTVAFTGGTTPKLDVAATVIFGGYQEYPV